ncbi:DNA recombination protein RmuC [Paucihalobacter ruber]|uniref:DNA recombination protein RmuC n=1 Tax=Paucihalobacter ruber TaxID=2567861 RepID=A0A506PJH9_9FLAO|nr:DNA recombination protein RmuC [Paucihalobacter ruber]TPV33779.1 DNA recombination protein RmuC [Paucihalobacter ruber]
METTTLIVLIFVFLLIGSVIGYFISNLKQKAAVSSLEERLRSFTENEIKLFQNIQDLEQERESIRAEKDQLSIELTRRNADFENLKLRSDEQKAEVEKLQERFQKEFENLANKILDEKSNKFTNQNKENLDAILKPLQEKIKSFEEKVENTQKESVGMHASLKEQLLNLKELNQQMTAEATNLTRALKGDSKMQGNWGELVLERVLEKSGLEKDREYFVQQSFQREDGTRVMPDVVLHLPDSKKMIIDAKVSLVDYERFVNATEEERPIYLKAHVNSIRKHIEQLSAKNYQDLYDIESPDFVLMFIPVEPAFAVAINDDNSLYNKAFEKNIVIVTPSTLLATLRTVDSMWSNEKQQQNALEIATQAGRLYDSFVNLTDDLLKVGNQINTVQNSYGTAMKKLTGKGNLISRVENLKKLGAKAGKSIDDKLLKRADQDQD